MQLVENKSLKDLNTFGIDAMARWYAEFRSAEDLAELSSPGPLILGGGSNILLTGNIDGLVLRNAIHGIDLIHEDENHVYVRAGAGETWHQFVLYCIGREWAGAENLSLIPGSVGAAPMQNIGAYGVEIKEIFHELEAWDLEEKRVVTFTLNDCAFGYRESVFKRQYRGRFVILNVTFRLNKVPVFHIEYGAIREELEKAGVQSLGIRAISDAVIRIRRSKLPDPAEIGNAGSFFKNPTVPSDQFAQLKSQFPGIVGYPNAPLSTASASSGAGYAMSKSPASESPSPSHEFSALQSDSGIKLAAGWLIEQCGWKGFRRGDAGCHSRQALVLVNYGHASGQEIFDLSTEILASVNTKFGVTLEREVNIV